MKKSVKKIPSSPNDIFETKLPKSCNTFIQKKYCSEKQGTPV